MNQKNAHKKSFTLQKALVYYKFLKKKKQPQTQVNIPMHKLLADHPDQKMLLLGNEAIARGAIEAGVAVATTYPGTPSSEISLNFFVTVEWWAVPTLL